MARRVQPGRKVKPVYYVFCEGETEERYVKFLKRYYRIPIEISSRKRNNISDQYIRKYKRGRPSHLNDKTFVMYDLDKEDTREIILNLQAKLLCSNPCIELWFLLHFKNHSAHLSSKDAIQLLEWKYPNYQKGKIDANLFNKLLEKNDNATARAKKLVDHENPSSTVYKLIELMKSHTDSK